MIRYAPLTGKQADYLRHVPDSWLNVAEGGKRAGKNILNIIAFAMCLDKHKDKLHLAAGITSYNARMNIVDSNGFGLQHIFGKAARIGKYEGMEALFVQTAVGEKIVVIVGGGMENSGAKIKGNSYGMAYLSEVNECNRGFFQEVLDRTLVSADRKLFFDLNPKPPGQWFYREFLDYQDRRKEMGENPGYNYGHFTIWDNLSISAKAIKAVLDTYDKSSLYYQTEILGKRLSATGRIYQGFGNGILLDGKACRERQYMQYAIGVDVGGTDATVATLIGMTTGCKTLVVLDGYYHKQGDETGYTHDRYAAEIVDRIWQWTEIFPGLGEQCNVFCESADKLFRQALQNKLIKQGLRLHVYAAYKKDGILDRIRLVNMLINQERLFLHKGMTEWIEAFENACWSEKEKSVGEWVRVDDGSYPLDCLDSLEYAIQPYKAKLLQ